MRLTTLQREQNAHDDNIWAVKWTSRGGLLTGSVDECCKLWSFDTDRGFEKETEFLGQSLGCVSIDVDASGETFATSGLDCVLRLYSLKARDEYAQVHFNSPESWSLEFNPQAEIKQLAMAAGCKGGVKLFKTEVAGADEEIEREICHLAPQPYGKGKESQKPFALGCTYHPSGSKVACSHSDGHIVLYDLEAQKHVLTFVGHNKPVRDLSFTSDGKFLISACDDNTCNLYDISHKNPIGSLNGHDSSVLCVEATQGGNNCVTGSSDCKIKVWDLNQRMCIQTLSEHKEAVWNLSYNTETHQVASVSDDASICIFQAN